MERVALAATFAALLVLLGGPSFINWVRRWARQFIREDAPKRHQTKAGTPTMGGILLVAGVIAATLLAAPLSVEVLLALAMMAGFALIGLIDDLRKVRLGRNLGLRARERLVTQTLVAVGVGLYVMYRTPLGSSVVLPWIGELDLGWLYLPFAVAFIMGFTNAANLADGLDGLAAGITAVAAAAYAAIAFRVGAADVGIMAAALAGACLGFLWFNAHPAQIFMGDVGSNALGAALAAMAIITKTELTLVVVGAVFVAEAFSVLSQVAYFKTTGGKRIFRMTPLHHHFELSGWTETQTVTRFWVVSALAALLGLTIVF